MAKNCFRFPVACALALVVAVVTPGTAQAVDICTAPFPSETFEFDPTAFDQSFPPDLTGIVEPESITFTGDWSSAPWVRLVLEIAGTTFESDADDGFSIGGELAGADLFQVLAFVGQFLYVFDSGGEFTTAFPAPDNFVAAVMDLSSYPISVTFQLSATEDGATVCSLEFILDVGGSSSGGCKGPYGYLCNYLDRFDKHQTGSTALPDTV